MTACDRFEREERHYHAEVGREKWLHAADAASRLAQMFRARAREAERRGDHGAQGTALAWAGYWGVRREEMQKLAQRHTAG